MDVSAGDSCGHTFCRLGLISVDRGGVTMTGMLLEKTKMPGPVRFDEN